MLHFITRAIKQDIFSKQEIIKRIVSLDAIFIVRRGQMRSNISVEFDRIYGSDCELSRPLYDPMQCKL